MNTTTRFTAIAMLAAVISTPLMAEDHGNSPPNERQSVTVKTPSDGFDRSMQEVVHNAPATAPSHGWRYFSDPAARRAVVISPQGDYYFSQRGKGLHWVAAEQAGS